MNAPMTICFILAFAFLILFIVVSILFTLDGGLNLK